MRRRRRDGGVVGVRDVCGREVRTSGEKLHADEILSEAEWTEDRKKKQRIRQKEKKCLKKMNK